MPVNKDDDFASMDVVFDLPPEVTKDPKLREMYEIITYRLRKQVEGLPLDTLQYLLAERIVSNYITIRSKEMSSPTFAGNSISKSMNTLLLNMFKELNSTLNISGADVLRSQIISAVGEAIMETLSTVEDANIREDLREKLAAKFEEIAI